MNAKYDFIFLPILYDTRFCINCYLSNSLLNLIQNFIHSWLYPWTGSIPKLDLGIYQIWQNPQLDVLILVNIYSNSSQNIYVLHLILASLIRTFGNCICSAAAAKSLQSCPTLCDPIDGSPPGSPVPGILQAGTLEWVAISFSNAWKWKGKVKSLSRVRLLATPWTAAYQALPSLGFSRQEYWSGLPFPSPMHEMKSESVVTQSCPTLRDPMYCSPPGSPVPGILQARILEWVAISSSNVWKWKVKVKSLSCVRLVATPFYQALTRKAYIVLTANGIKLAMCLIN